MVSRISSGVEVKVETFYQHDFSDMVKGEYVFAYRITIENLNDFTIRLKSRRWFIFDSGNDIQVVEGEGVVGVQPILPPGINYQYTSACHLSSDMGRMSGSYIMENLYNKQEFEVEIPSFELIVPVKLN